MDSSGGQSQEMSSDSLGNMLVRNPTQSQSGDRKQARPQPEQALKCPRCDSTNTKFCYYNNYSLTQPRYFCKSCRRYWTKGGTLRNVPVGGGCRKNRRSSSSSSAATSSSSATSALSRHNNNINNNNPLLLHPNNYINTLSNSSPVFSQIVNYDQNDLTLAFARLHQKPPCGGQLGNNNGLFGDGLLQLQQPHFSIFGPGGNNGNDNLVLGMNNNNNNNNINTSSSAATSSGFLDALRGGFLDNHHHQIYDHHNHHQQQQQGYDNNDNDDHDHDHDNDNDHQVSEAPVTTSTAAVTVTTVKQELCNNNGNRMLWGCPWQVNNGNGNGINGPLSSSSDHHQNQYGIGNMADFEGSTTATTTNGRPESWNGFATSWHGLLNTTPLM